MSGSPFVSIAAQMAPMMALLRAELAGLYLPCPVSARERSC